MARGLWCLSILVALGVMLRAMAAQVPVEIGSYTLPNSKVVKAYSNGTDTGTGNGAWQCVELVARYAKLTGHVLPAISVAKNLCPRVRDRASGLTWLRLLPNKGSEPPRAGDILGFDDGGKYGHVALITAVDDSRVQLLEQNWSQYQGVTVLPLVHLLSGGWQIPDRKGKARTYRVQGWCRPKELDTPEPKETCLVLDTSLAMKSHQVQALEALRNYIQSLGSTGRVTVVGYADLPSRWINHATVLSAQNPTRAIIQGVRFDGDANLGSALLDVAALAPMDSNIHCVVVTSGLQQFGDIKAGTAACKQRHVRVSVIVLDRTANMAIFRELAETTGGAVRDDGAVAIATFQQLLK